MSVTDQTPLLQRLQLQEELRSTVGERTLQILDRRRRTAVVKRRGWLVRPRHRCWQIPPDNPQGGPMGRG